MYLVTFRQLNRQIGLARAGSPVPGAKQPLINEYEWWIWMMMKTSLSSTSLPAYPDSKQDYLCLGLSAEGPAGSSVLLCFIVISLSVPYAFINLACSFSLHALILTNCFVASFNLSLTLSNIICATFAVCKSPVLTAIERLLAASLIMSCSCEGSNRK